MSFPSITVNLHENRGEIIGRDALTEHCATLLLPQGPFGPIIALRRETILVP